MKTVINDKERGWYFLPDSATANAGKPFFIPEFAPEDEFEALLTPVVRINRIGKSIAARFAPRYFAEVAPAVHFRDSRLRAELISKGFAPDPAQAFDRAMIAGDYIPLDSFSPSDSIKMLIDGDVVAEVKVADLVEAAGSFLEAVSRTNTMKMGDVLAPVAAEGHKIAIGQHITVSAPDRDLLNIAIK